MNSKLMKILYAIALSVVCVLGVTFTACDGDDVVPPVFYSVTFDVDGGSTVATQTVEEGSKAQKPDDPTKAGYDFTGWFKADKTTEFDFDTETVTADVTVYAKWTRITYAVTFDVDGGSEVATQTVEEGSKAQKPDDPTKVGHEFTGWYKADKTTEFDFDTETITANVTVYAKWEKLVYAVTFDADGGSAVTAQNVAYGDKAEKPDDPTKAGYEFKGWLKADKTTEFDFETETVTANVTVYAKWEKIVYAVTFDVDGGSTVATQIIDEGLKAQKPDDPTKTGYEFKGWYKADKTTVFDFDTETITANVTVYAKWEKLVYAVTFDADGGSEVTEQKVAYGDKAEKPADPKRAGYEFKGWLKADKTTVFNFDAETITANVTVYAKWEKIPAYYAVFNCDENVQVYVYNSQDYSEEPYLSDIAYSRNGKNGNYDETGDGQINILIAVTKGYVIDSITINGSYKNLKDPSETGNANTYKITKVASNLEIDITSTQIEGAKMITALSSNTATDGKISFAWEYLYDAEFVNVTVTCDGVETPFRAEEKSFEYDLQKDKSYYFEFVPYYNEEICGEAVKVHRAYSPDAKDVAFARMEIQTADFIWPTCDYVNHPEGCWGEGITNNSYVQSSIKLYDATNTLLFDTADILKKPADQYSGAKLKIRGNSSAYGVKKPYKIKLNKALDLLGGLYTRTKNPDYASKEFVLLARGQMEEYFIAREISNLVTDEYEFAYAYISLFVNGDFQGIYVLTDAVNADSCNVDTDGYVVEYDAYWWNEDLYFETILSEKYLTAAITFKYPDADDIAADSDEVAYIKSYIDDFEKKLLAKEDVSFYIDIPSFSSWLLVHDVLASYDAGGSNIYLVKNNSTTSLLHAGPTWDFDSSFTRKEQFAAIHYALWYYMAYLLEYDAFVTEYTDQLSALKTVYADALSGKLDAMFDDGIETMMQYENSAFGEHYKGFKARVLERIEWLGEHITWMENNI